MQIRTIGSLKVSLAGLGCNNFGGRCDEEQTRAVVNAALDAGITFFDTADIYGGTKSEEFLGRALAGVRDSVVIATKFGMQIGDDPVRKGGSARWVKQACEDSLRRLGVDVIDLYQFHVPDKETPIEETLGALDDLVRAGKVREIGNSNFSGEQIAEAESVARAKSFTRFVSAQNHYNLLNRGAEKEVLPACARDNLAFLPYFPLASGLLTGKYARDVDPPKGTRLGGIPAERRARVMSEENFAIIEELTTYASERGHTLLELAISWLASNEAVSSVIAGATKADQVRANAQGVSWAMTAQERGEIGMLASA